MQNKIFITNQVEKVRRGDYTDFLDPNLEHQVISILNKYHIKYNILKLFSDCEKSIIYTDKYPNISLLEIESNNILNHKDILGSLFSHNISIYKYGDIIITGKYYLPVLDSIKPYILSNITSIGKFNIKIKEVDINTISNYHYEYDVLDILVSSLRIDNIVSTLVNSSRSNTEELFKDKFVFVNYEPILKKTHTIKEGDIIGIRKNGKYRFDSIVKITNKDKYIIRMLKYK